MRALLLLPAGLTALVAASAEVAPVAPTLDQALAGARAEASAADAEVQRLDRQAAASRNTAQRLRAQRLSAAQAIAAAEARITAADAEARLIAARQQSLQARLRQQQQPISMLLGGLAQMADRPPLLMVAAGGNAAEDLIRLRILIDSTMPVIRRRTAALQGQLAASARLQRAAALARGRLRQGRDELAAKRRQFAELEASAISAATSSQEQAIDAGDMALAASETLDLLGARAAAFGTASAVASELAREPAPPSSPAASAVSPALAFDYRLPADALVTVGLGSVSPSGVRSRGIELNTGRGAPVSAPARGTIRFAGPFQDYDGVVIIDHGDGWLSLIVNVATVLKPGTRVEIGSMLGRALGPIEVELSHNGRRFSPALIAGSSRPLSNDRPNR